jgi:RNA polymerase sigma-70 factor (ECF subfamily)
MEEFEQVYRQHATAVYQVSLSTVGRKKAAESITSETFYVLRQNWNGVDRELLPAWLFTIATQQAVEYWRREFRQDRRISDPPSDQHRRESEQSLTSLLRQCQGLKPVDRICIVLRFVHGLSKADIAQYTNLTESQVKSHLQHTLHLLRGLIASGRQQGLSSEGVSADV